MMKVKQLYAFDFHGVLSEGNEKAVQYYVNLAFSTFGIKAMVEISTIIMNYGISFNEIFKMAYPRGDQELFQKMTEFVYQKQKQSFKPVIDAIRPQKFAKVTLEILNELDCDCVVVSNTPQKVIKKFTDAVKLTKHFKHIVGVDQGLGVCSKTHLSLAKAAALRRLLECCKYERVVMIGDAPNDIFAGKAVGAETFLFRSPSHDKICDTSLKWKRIISQCSPDHVVDDLRNIIK